MKSPILYFIIIGILLFISACTDDVKIDESAPNIRVTAPFENGEYTTNDKFIVTLEITDDIDLKELTLRMHDNSIPHEEENSSLSIFDWDTTINMNVSGTKTDLQFELPLPDILSSVADYHLVVMSMDKSGNQTPWKEIPFKLVLPFDNESPIIKLTSVVSSPPVIGTFANDQFVVLAEINDNVLLNEVRITLKDSAGIVYEEVIIDGSQINGASYRLQQFFTAPIEPGEYNVEILAKDEAGNEQYLSITLKVIG